MNLVTSVFPLPSEKPGMFRRPQQMLKPPSKPSWIFCHLLEYILFRVLGQQKICVLLLGGFNHLFDSVVQIWQF